VDNSALKLKPGMTANIEVVYAERTTALRVPNAAIRFRPPTELVGKSPPPVPLDRKMVWVRRGAVSMPVLFRPGVSDGAVTEVVDGDIQPDDEVITEAIPTRSAPPKVL